MNDPPTFLSLFAGIGGFDLALDRTGWRCVGQVELDPFCTRVLAARFPGVPRWGDVRAVGISPPGRESDSGQLWESGEHRPDLLVGGFPCQDFSVAGKRAGLVGYRGTLFWEIVRIAKEIQPTWGLFENVPGLLSSRRGRDFWAVLQGLRDCWPAVGWRILDSRYFGVPQRRRRIYFVCGPSEEHVASVLFEPEGGGGHPAASREAGACTAAGLTSGSHGAGVSAPGRRQEDDENLIVGAIRHLGSGGPDDNEAQGGHLIVGALPALDTPRGHGFAGFACDQSVDAGHIIAHALSAEGADASEDGTRRGTPMVIEMAHRGANQTGVRSGSSYPVSATQAVLQSAVRRLTPLECERLQAFPDGWTCLCQPLEAYVADPEQAAWECQCPDGPRYRALGNTVTVSVVEWIGRRLQEQERR